MHVKHSRVDRRTILLKGGRMVVAFALVSATARTAFAADKKKGKSSKEDFFFQEEPGELGRTCTGCVNFTAKSSGQYGADSGDCALLEGDVCTHCYCQGWTDKKTGKKAGT
ncbi:MAG TPA: hypothetical protein VMU08_08175 [Rhizomicrobium sp.]|nr:hypothetical protein [Rhizomicrobium sp.]